MNKENQTNNEQKIVNKVNNKKNAIILIIIAIICIINVVVVDKTSKSNKEEETTTTSTSTTTVPVTTVSAECEKITKDKLTKCGYNEFDLDKVVSNVNISTNNELIKLSTVSEFKLKIEEYKKDPVIHSYKLENGKLYDKYNSTSDIIFNNVKYLFYTGTEEFDSTSLIIIVTNNNDIYSLSGWSGVDVVEKSFEKIENYSSINENSLYVSYAEYESILLLYNNTSKSCFSFVGEKECAVTNKKNIKAIDSTLTIFDDNTISYNNKTTTSKIKTILEENMSEYPSVLLMDNNEVICFNCNEVGKEKTSIIKVEKVFANGNKAYYLANNKLYEVMGDSNFIANTK